MATPNFVNQYRDIAGLFKNNSDLPEMVQKNAGSDTVIDYPWSSNEPSSLTRTSNGMSIRGAERFNNGLTAGIIDTENNLIKPQNEPDFMTNYRETTKRLGARAALNNIDKTTQKIMDKITLPSYYDALSDKEREHLRAVYEINPEFATDSYSKDVQEWNDNNYKYRVRAAQVLKNMSSKEREKIYSMLNMEPETGKKMLDEAIEKWTEKENKAISDLASPFVKAFRDASKGVDDFINKITGQRYLTEEEQEALKKELRGEKVTTGEEKSEGTADTGTKTSATTENKSTFDPNDAISYTYKKGDTFGQVIKNLGLQTSNGLWGPNGDVEYYTQQLIDQGVWPDGVRGNIPIGTTIKLTKRK